MVAWGSRNPPMTGRSVPHRKFMVDHPFLDWHGTGDQWGISHSYPLLGQPQISSSWFCPTITHGIFGSVRESPDSQWYPNNIQPWVPQLRLTLLVYFLKSATWCQIGRKMTEFACVPGNCKARLSTILKDCPYWWQDHLSMGDLTLPCLTTGW